MLNIIVAATRDYGIGLDNRLAWNYPQDLTYFQKITMTNSIDPSVRNTLIMGRKTAESLPNGLPLPDRTNILLTCQSDYVREGFIVANDLLSALEMTVKVNPSSEIFVIGGAQIYSDVVTNYPNLVKRVYLTQVMRDYVCDVKVPELGEYLEKHCERIELRTKIDSDDNLNFFVYRPILNPVTATEQAYLNLLRDLCLAPMRETRNSKTKSLFSSHLTFELQEGFPLLTTKRVFWKGIVNELLFFLGGCTDNQWLKNRGVHIWDANTTSEFLAKCGLPYPPDTLGPMYGAQFRYYGAEYKGKDVDYTGQGKDQFAEVIDLLLNDPHSRRILMTSYNYDQVKLGALYPCHSLVLQFYVEEKTLTNETTPIRYVSLQMYQRSCDWCCGAPYNIASNALLMHIVVSILNGRSSKVKYDVGKLHMVFGDYHLYENHIRNSLLQMSRIPRIFPKLVIHNQIESIEPKYFLGLESSNFEIVDYQPYPVVKYEMIA